MLLPSQIEDAIVANLDCDFIEVKGDDGTHFEATIVSPLFEDKSMIKQHQMVYQALGDRVGGDIHALSINTYTKEEWHQLKNLKGIQ